MNEFSIVWKVMLPTAIPALLAFAIFSVVAHWNDYFWPRVVITGTRIFTPPLGLREFRGGSDGSDWGAMMATATIIITPLIVAFLMAQKRFIGGLAHRYEVKQRAKLAAFTAMKAAQCPYGACQAGR